MPAYCYLLIPNQACFLLSNFQNAYSMQIPHWLPDNQLTPEIRQPLVFYRYRPYPPIRHSFVSHRTLPTHHLCRLWVISDPHSPFQLQNLTLISDILLSPPMSSSLTPLLKPQNLPHPSPVLSVGNQWPSLPPPLTWLYFPVELTKHEVLRPNIHVRQGWWLNIALCSFLRVFYTS